MVVMVVSVIACSDSTGPPHVLDVTIAVSAVTVSLSAPVTVMVTAINRGPDPVEVSFSTCPFRFSVIGGNGQNLGSPSFLCDLALRVRTLQTGDIIEFDHRWDGRMHGPDGVELLPPGPYQLIGGVRRGRSDPVLIAVVDSG